MANLRELWNTLRLGGFPAEGAAYRLQLLDAKPDLRVFAALAEPDLLPALLIEIPEKARPRSFAHVLTRAFEAVVADFAGLPKGHVGVAIQLRELSYEDLFSLLCDEIVGAVRVTVTPSEAAHAVVRCIERWKRFLERGRGVLSDEQVRGLIGELVILGRCTSRFGARAAVTAWTGPQDALRDFELPDASVEVKTFQSDTGASVRINDPQQLDETTARPVYLAAVQLAQVQSNGRTLPEYVAAIGDLLTREPDAVGLFGDRLAEYGYVPPHAPRYTQRFIVEKVLLHVVRQGFPRIQATEVPAGVVNVHFSVLLASIAAFRVEPAAVVGVAAPSVEHTG